MWARRAFRRPDARRTATVDSSCRALTFRPPGQGRLPLRIERSQNESTQEAHVLQEVHFLLASGGRVDFFPEPMTGIGRRNDRTDQGECRQFRPNFPNANNAPAPTCTAPFIRTSVSESRPATPAFSASGSVTAAALLTFPFGVPKGVPSPDDKDGCEEGASKIDE